MIVRFFIAVFSLIKQYNVYQIDQFNVKAISVIYYLGNRMSLGKKLLPWLLIASSLVIAFITYQRQVGLEHAKRQLLASSQAKADASQQVQKRVAKPSFTQVARTYQCDQQKTIQAIYTTYPSSQAKPPHLTLNIDGQSYEMYSVPAQVGSLYATEQGINPEQGMRWHVQGLEARLVSMTLDHTAKPENEKLLLRCQEPL